MTLSAIIFGNIFNFTYGEFTLQIVPLFLICIGRIYDSHVTLMPDGRQDCPDGRLCYSGAYWITSAASFVGLAVILWSIRHDHVKKAKAKKAFRTHSREA